MAYVAVMVLLLLICCLLLLPLFTGSVFGTCFVNQYVVPFWFYNHLDGEERAGCFTLIVFLMSCVCLCSVALPHGAVG